MLISYLVCAGVHTSSYQINAKQSSAQNVAIKAAHTVVEQQYKIKDSAGQKASAKEIQAIIKSSLTKTLGSGQWERLMQVERSVQCSHYLYILKYALSPSMALFSIHASWQLLQKSVIPRVAFALGCPQHSAPCLT